MKKSISIKIITVLLCILCVFAFGCACNVQQSSTPPEEKEKLDIGRYTLTLSLLDDYTFTVTADGDTEDIQWSSENESVATVKNGVVTPIAVGKTKITAKLEEEQATCILTVIDDNILPSLVLSDSQLNVKVGDTYNVSAQLKYKGNTCQNVSYSFESENGDVASVDSNGLIAANGLGETRVKVVATWKNVDTVYTTEYVTVRVLKSVDIVFNEQRFSLSAIDGLAGEVYTNEAGVSCEVYVDGTKVDSSVTFSVEDEGVCSLTGNVLKGLKGGTTYVTASTVIDGYEYVNSVEVEIYRPLIEREETVYLETMDTDISYIFDGEEVTDLTIYSKDKQTNYTVRNNRIVSFSMSVGEISLDVYNDKYGYRYESARVVDLYVQTTEDVKTMRQCTDGYFLLGNDIDMSGVDLEVYGHGFTGTIDGNGKMISNLSYDKVNLSLFKTLSGTVKDLALVNVALGSGVQSGALSIHANNAILDNVYISINYGGSNHSGGVSKYVIGAVSMKNTVINALSNLTNNSGMLFGFAGTSDVTLSKTYAISLDENATLVGGRNDDATYIKNRDAINALNHSENKVVYALVDFETDLRNGSVSVKNESLYKAVCAPKLIKTAEEFLALRNETSGYYRLANDIDLSKAGALGTSPNITFSGIIDGDGYAVSGMKLAALSGQQNNLNGFWRTFSGTITNLTVLDATLGSVNGDQGGIFASIIKDATFENVYVNVTFATGVTYNGSLAKDVQGTLKMVDCVIVAEASTTNDWCGLLASFPTASANDITLTNTYFITESAMKIVGRDSGSYAANYTAINEAFADKIYTRENFEAALEAGSVTVNDRAAYDEIRIKINSISTVEEFLALRKATTGYYKLVNDIDLSEAGYLEVADNLTFSGVLDGNGHTVSGMKIATVTEGKQTNIDGFWRTLSGTVKNLTVVNATVGAGGSNQGGVFAATILNATFENVYVDVTFYSSGNYNGGLAKDVQGTLKMENCVIVAHAAGGNANSGLLASFPTASANDITLTNTYFITESAMKIVGRDSGSYAANYTAINEAFADKIYTRENFEAALDAGSIAVNDRDAYDKVVGNE